MPGELTPLVLLPRHTTYAGASVFVTIAMDVTEYSSALVNCWRGKLVGTDTPTFLMLFEESSDQLNWTACDAMASFDPGQETEVQKAPTLTKRWFRVKATLGGTGPVATCWAVGFLVGRLS